MPLDSSVGQKWRDMMVGWTEDFIRRISKNEDWKGERNLQLSAIGHARLSVLNPSYPSTSLRKPEAPPLRTES